MVLLTGKVTQMLTMPEPHPATYLMRRNNHGAEKKLKALARRVLVPHRKGGLMNISFPKRTHSRHSA